MLAPTRELAKQISSELNKLRYQPDEYCILTLYGGKQDVYHQAQLLNDRQRSIDIVVGTTGRVKDHI